MNTLKSLITEIGRGSFNALARAITLVENDIAPAAELLRTINTDTKVPVIGITGPPGAGKSTLVNAVTAALVKQGKKVAILAIDPTSPFNFGSLLGDRIRMAQLFNHPGVYIRSLATRGALGGISAKTIEIVDVLKAGGFDLILVETVGVGQSEVEIAGLADKTIVVLVPESGDEIQQIKSGLMEIAQGFVVNKADREGADTYANNLKKLVHHQQNQIPVFKTVADKAQGIAELCEWLLQPALRDNERKSYLLTEKAFKIIQHYRMADVDRKQLHGKIREALKDPGFNIYRFTDNWV
ncbi:methylmalonyl Co-A mutase-associated GTPase MeaB [Pedobacter heparinus]|uniref:LAO/AO transport system ATPase n=1 Tax=Pedobacter heparinus (strain ATCC 13125 / DSM 2366 / CIP 104194 / JCM 7457 / NBRC 12017 / NCIMB 9290 / NRRL B-14731 / HIM 762-3) TaxID=485917 RepID=C6XYB2_PEDHD|nr:methylmalonyl Co-A mutase-associated GTPase MeaB [Pedobacter heparinus]ACU02379.1 LAO/AO transport system ATPase [Pedobacter heparinus DSM 2366]